MYVIVVYKYVYCFSFELYLSQYNISAVLIDMLETPPHPQQAKSSCQAQGLLRPSPDVDLRVGGIEPFIGWLVTKLKRIRGSTLPIEKLSNIIQPYSPRKPGSALAKPSESISKNQTMLLCIVATFLPQWDLSNAVLF